MDPFTTIVSVAAALLPLGDPCCAMVARHPERQQDSTPPQHGVEVVESLGIARTEILPCRMSFAPAEMTDLEDYHLSSGKLPLRTEWLPLTRWPDGSIRDAAAIVHCAFAANTSTRLLLARGPSTPIRDFYLHPAIRSQIPAPGGRRPWFEIVSEVEDHAGTIFRARLIPDPTYRHALRGKLLRTRRFRDYHRGLQTPLGRDLLSLTGWIELHFGSNIFALDLQLGNDYLGASTHRKSTPAEDPEGHPFGGAIRLRRWSIRFRRLRAQVAWARQVGASPPRTHMGWTVIDLLPPAKNALHVLADGQTLVRRIFFQSLHEQTSREQDREQLDQLLARVRQPLVARPLLPALRASGAYGLQMGIGPSSIPVADLRKRVSAALKHFRRGNHFGPFGSFGARSAILQGGLHPDSYAPLLAFYQGADAWLLQVEPQVYQQLSLSSLHLFGLDVQNQSVFRGGLAPGRPVDPELYGPWRARGADANKPSSSGSPQFLPLPERAAEIYLLTLRPYLKDQVELLMNHAVALSRTPYGITTRGEARVLRAALTGEAILHDQEVRKHFARRTRNVVLPAMGPPSGSREPCYAQEQPPAEDAWGPGISWDSPWQAGELLAALCAAYRGWGDSCFLEAAIRTGRFLAAAWHPEVAGAPGGMASCVPLFDLRGGHRMPIPVERSLGVKPIHWQRGSRRFTTTWKRNLGLTFDDPAIVCESPLLTLAHLTAALQAPPPGIEASAWPALRERWQHIAEELHAHAPPDAASGLNILGLDEWRQAQRDRLTRDRLELLSVPNPNHR